MSADPAGLDDRGWTAHQAGQFEEAERLYLEAVSILEQGEGAARIDLVNVLGHLSALYDDFEQYEDALSAAETAQMVVDEFETIFEGEEGALIRMQCLTAASNALRGLERTADAEPVLREALAIAGTAFGSAHPEYAVAAHNLSVVLRELRRPGESRRLGKAALRILEREFAAADPRVAAVRDNLRMLG